MLIACQAGLAWSCLYDHRWGSMYIYTPFGRPNVHAGKSQRAPKDTDDSVVCPRDMPAGREGSMLCWTC